MSPLVALALVTGLLHGVVTRGPTQPVCQVGKPCSAPAVGVTLVFSRAGHPTVRVRTIKGGYYSVKLASGIWAVRLQPQPTIGSGMRPRTAHVVAGADRRVNFYIDTGIR
jgi:hypothetical protein